MQSSQRNRRAWSCQARLINRFEMPALNNSFVTEKLSPLSSCKSTRRDDESVKIHKTCEEVQTLSLL